MAFPIVPRTPEGFREPIDPASLGNGIQMDFVWDPDAAGDTLPVIFVDLADLNAAVLALPTLSGGGVIPNRVWISFGDADVGTGGTFDFSNSDFRGASRESFFDSAPPQGVLFSGFAGFTEIENPKKVEDLFIDVGFGGNSGPFFIRNFAWGTQIQNVTCTAPGNGAPGAAAFQVEASCRVRLDYCRFLGTGIDITTPDLLTVDCGNGNFFGPGAFNTVDAGATVHIRSLGSGNTFDPLMDAGIGTLEFNIGQGSGPEPSLSFNGSDSLQFGCGNFDIGANGTTGLFPGGHTGGSDAGQIGVFTPKSLNQMHSGVIRGIQLQAGGAGVVADFVDVQVQNAGFTVYADTVFSSNFEDFVNTVGLLGPPGFILPGIGFVQTDVQVAAPVPGPTTAAGGFLNCTILLK